MSSLVENAQDTGRLLWLSARSLAGRYFWLVPLLPLLWHAFLGWRLIIDVRPEYAPYEAQGNLMSVPMSVVGILLGVRIIAGEIDKRTLEIAYTVPGGTHRLWLAKFTATFLLIVASEAVLATTTFVFFTEFPLGALYGALQAATFYLALAMALAALFKSEATGALGAVAVLTLNGLITNFGRFQLRVSPFWNPNEPGLRESSDAMDIVNWTIQNRVGFLMAIAAVVVLAVARAERREKLLGS